MKQQQQQQQCQEIKQPIMWQPYEPNNNLPTDPQTAAAVAAAAFLQWSFYDWLWWVFFKIIFV